MDMTRQIIRIEGTGRAVEVWQKGAGPDVVFLHGAGGIPGWGPDLELLAQRYRVTVPFFPGFGVSDGIETIDDVLDAALHTYDVLRKLGVRRPHLIGHSMGGMIAAEMAAICPNDVGRVALISPVGLWNDAHPVLDFFTVMPQEIAKYIFHDQKHPLAVAMSTMPEPDDAGLVDLYVNYVKGLSAAGRLLWPIPDRGLKKRLHRVIAPTLILWGEHDGLVPVFYAKEFQKAIRGARLKIVKSASHMAMLEQPKVVAAAIASFFAESSAGALALAARSGAGAPATAAPKTQPAPARVTAPANLAAEVKGKTSAPASAKKPSPQKKTSSAKKAPYAKPQTKTAPKPRPAAPKKKSPPVKAKSAPKRATKPAAKKAATKKAAPKKTAPKKPQTAPKKMATPVGRKSPAMKKR